MIGKRRLPLSNIFCPCCWRDKLPDAPPGEVAHASLDPPSLDQLRRHRLTPLLYREVMRHGLEKHLNHSLLENLRQDYIMALRATAPEDQEILSSNSGSQPGRDSDHPPQGRGPADAVIRGISRQTHGRPGPAYLSRNTSPELRRFLREWALLSSLSARTPALDFGNFFAMNYTSTRPQAVLY